MSTTKNKSKSVVIRSSEEGFQEGVLEFWFYLIKRLLFFRFCRNIHVLIMPILPPCSCLPWVRRLMFFYPTVPLLCCLSSATVLRPRMPGGL